MSPPVLRLPSNIVRRRVIMTPSVKFLHSPEQNDPRGRTQGYQGLARRHSELGGDDRKYLVREACSMSLKRPMVMKSPPHLKRKKGMGCDDQGRSL